MTGRRGGCLLRAILATLFLAALGGGTAYLVYSQMVGMARDGTATSFETVVGAVVTDNLPPQETGATLGAIASIAARIRSGEIASDPKFTPGDIFLRSPVLPAIIAAAFEKRFLRTAEMAEPNRQKARMNISRFVHGILSRTIQPEEVDAILAPLVEKALARQKEIRRLKHKISPQEAAGFVATVERVVAESGIPEQEFLFDLPAELEKLLAPPAAAQ